MKTSNILKAVSVALLASACNDPGAGYFGTTAKLSQLDSTSGAPNVPAPAPTNTVCDPFGNGGGTLSKTNGLVGELFRLNPTRSPSEPGLNLTNFQTDMLPVNLALFFSDLYVPTRPFTSGFTTQSGATLEDPVTKEIFTEGFLIHFRSSIGVTASEAGRYQFAIISDDGSVMKINDKGTELASDFRSLISSPGTQSSKMTCAQEILTLDDKKRMPIDLEYFQGPKTQIALVLMWRKVSANAVISSSDASQAQCGKSGNDYFFAGSTDSAPLQPWQDLLAAGWEPVPASNFFVPDSVKTNPCVQ